ncbi:hypothetical protein BLS_006332 [Venturia inaequalis]|uniref:FAD/NAD(P)-binding domain-containing protein n=1 Tax=Venturia inaequalis TaxID=5025 RepID=A0A8H3UDK2_VENIN|nr:hypothetical protein BLS_006332 [Venturia inaequalis]
MGDSTSTNLYAASGTATDRNEIQVDYDGAPAQETDSAGYKIREQPYGTKRKIRVLLMGAGASSLNFFKKAEEEMQNIDIVCYEKNRDVGGTWLENRYPEIHAYLKEIEQENNFIDKYVRLRHAIEHAQWDSDAGLWRFKIRNLETDEVIEDAAEFFINAGGVLNQWKWPEIPGLHDFKGKLMHSANYEEGYVLDGKRVAVIGAGSSGVQIVAAIQKKVDTLYHWIRSPIWITAGFAQRWAAQEGANFKYTPEQIQHLKDNPNKYLEYRKQIENELNQRFKFIIRGSAEAAAARDYALQEMKNKLNHDARLCDKIIPKNFNPGCRRPTPAPGYLEALVAPNATVFTEEIGKIDATGFFDAEGKHHDVDVIICATGFNTSWLPRFPLINGEGKSLTDLWGTREGVTSYLSIGIPTFPNLFSFCGPYGPLGHGSFMPLIEQWTKYMFTAISKAQVENIKAYTPRMDLSKQFRQHADLFLQRTAWTSPCRSWFKQGRNDGQAAIYPGSRLHFLQLLKTPRYEDFDIEYWDENRYAFLGNGFEVREFDGRDITNYLGCLDDEGRDVQPDYDEGLIDILGGLHVGEKYIVNGPKAQSIVGKIGKEEEGETSLPTA